MITHLMNRPYPAPGYDWWTGGTPNDSFDGTNGNPANTSRWITTEDEAAVEIQSNKLNFLSTGAGTSLENKINSLFFLYGDFNISCPWDAPTSGDPDWYFGLRVYTKGDGEDQTYCEVYRERTGALNRSRGVVYNNSIEVQDRIINGDTSTSGTLRISRSGNDFTYYQPSDGTTNWGGVTCSDADSKPIAIRFNLRITNSITSVNLNNFVINSSDEIWKEA